MEFITTGNRIAVENFDIGKIYTITWETGNYKSLACTGKGTDFVMFQDQEPDLLFCLTMDSAISVSSIDEGGSGGTNNYNELSNKPSINGFVLVGNKTGAELGLASQSDLEDYATNASVVAGLAGKQDALSSAQLQAVNSGITSALVTQIGTNTSAIAGKQDALSSSQLQAVNSGITSALVTQIGTNTSAIAGKQDALSSSQLQAVNSGITSALVTQIGTNTSAIAGKQDALISSQLQAVNSGITSTLVTQIGTNTSAIAGKQDALSSSQLQAVNSGITSADVAQITTNKNNISSLKPMGQYTMSGTTNPDTGNTTFAGLFKLALDDLGLSTSTLHHYIVYIYTNTVSPTAELLIMYGTFQYNTTITHYAIHSSQIAYYVDNTQGTLAVSGGTAPVKATVRYLD